MHRTNHFFIIGLVFLFNGTVFSAIALSSKLVSFGALGVGFFTLGTLALFLFNAQRKKMAAIQRLTAKTSPPDGLRKKKMHG